MKMPRSRSQIPKPDPSLTAEEQGLVTPVPEGTDPDSLPFQEFSDQDINAEKWDQQTLTKVSTSTKDRSASIQPKIQFEDPQEVRLPPGISAHQWKRCSEIYTNVNFVVFTPLSEYLDLITPNSHLLGSEFYRNFISSIETLLYIGCTKPFLQEYENPAFLTVGNRPWRPWHHIYSNCKINKGEHSPLQSRAGKYIVRLFWLGTWRKIYVDDLLPVDVFGNILVPTLQKPKAATQPSGENVQKVAKDKKGKSKEGSPVRKETIQLWPMILCKALLKIASLTSCLDEANDFDIIHQLTGWIPQRIKTKDIAASDLWDIFMAYIERFEWDETKEAGEKKPKSAKTKPKGKGPDAPKKGAKAFIPSGVENMLDGNRFVVVSCNNFEMTEEGEEPKTGNLPVFISQVRDIPIIKPPPRPELEFWKTFRYENWAVEQGIIPPDIKKLNIKSLKIIDPFRRLMKDAGGGSQLYDTNATQDMENIDKKSEKSSKSSKKSTKAKTTHLEPDPSMWLDFNDIQALISHINIYFEPRSFKSKVKISDINFSYKTNNFNHIISPIVLKESRNEPIYLFMDSIDCKLLMLNLSQMGDPDIFQKTISPEEEVEIRQESLEHDICEEIILEKTKVEEKSKSTLEVVKKFSACKLKRQSISVVLEEYAWKCNSIGPPKATINTFGSKSVLIDLKPGRTSFRLWISSHCPYVLQVFSDTAARVGCLEAYLAACVEESQLLTHLCYEVSSCYGRLVQSFGMPDYAQNLRNFYNCYKPSRQLTKQELATMHRVFLEEFCRMVSENYVSFGAVECVRLLFLQLKTFDYCNPYLEEPHLYPNKFELDEQVEYAKLMQRAAVKVQAFFKRIYIRSLMGKMKESHKEYNGIFDNLKKVYAEIFSSGKRLSYCPTLIRRFFERKEMEALNEKFEVFRDIQSVLDLQVFNGTLTVQEMSWIPICRYEFYINAHEPVYIKVNFFCNLKSYSIRVFDNDTLEEVKHIGHDVIVQLYHNNMNGYTALCHGWSGEDTKINWKFVLATAKISRSDVVLIPSLAVATQTFKDNYMPNPDNIICRQIVKVGSSSFLTASLTSSYDHARLCLRLLDEKGKVIRQAYGVKNVLFPLVLLKWDEKSDTNIHEQIQTGKKRVTTISGFSDITYTKMHKKYNHSDSDSESSSLSKKISFTSTDSITKKHKRKTGYETIDGDEISFGSTHSDDSEKSHHRKSQVKILPKGSISSKSRSGSRAVAVKYLNKVLESVQTHYILEAKVVDDSWPLTADEWNRVQKLREKSYLNLLGERRTSVKKQAASKKSSLALDEPYWTLDFMFVSGTALDFEPDHTQSEFRKEMKMKWFTDIERYKRAVQIRENYLEENTLKIQSENEIDRSTRSNNPKDFATRILKEEPLEPYMIKPLEEIDEDFCKTKSDDDYIIEEANIDRVIKEYEADEEAIHDDIVGYIAMQADDFEVLSKWLQELKEDSQEELLSALLAEREYVKKVTQASSKSKSEKKGKGKKKK